MVHKHWAVTNFFLILGNFAVEKFCNVNLIIIFPTLEFGIQRQNGILSVKMYEIFQVQNLFEIGFRKTLWICLPPFSTGKEPFNEPIFLYFQVADFSLLSILFSLNRMWNCVYDHFSSLFQFQKVIKAEMHETCP